MAGRQDWTDAVFLEFFFSRRRSFFDRDCPAAGVLELRIGAQVAHAYIVMAYIVMAYVVMAYIVLA